MATKSHCAYCGARGPLHTVPAPLNSPRPVVFREYPPAFRVNRTRILTPPRVCADCEAATSALFTACVNIDGL